MNSTTAPVAVKSGEPRIVIIGGGIAGLSAGIFARANGFDATILEKHTSLGGECTGWDRKGYHIDGCIHWLVGTKEGTPMNDLWKNVGALDGVQIHHPETFLTYEHKSGTVPIYRDLDRLRVAWVELSPQDEAAIEEFVSTIRQLGAVEMEAAKPMDMMSLVEKARYILSMKDAGAVLRRYSKIGLAEYAERFRHPAIRAMFATFAPGDYAVAFLFFGLATFAQGQSSIPIGGSKALADRMAERYLALGGRVETGCEVIGVEIEGKRVSHLTTADGRTFTADHYIAACDAHLVFERLLGGRYRDPAFEKRFNDPETYPLASNTYIGLGLVVEVGDMPRTVHFECKPIQLGGTVITQITLNHYAYEPGFAPPGCTAMTVALNHFGEAIDHWFALADDRAAYRREKERVGEAIRDAIEAHFPRFAGKLTVLDVATPATYARYCNAYRGAFMGFFPTTRSSMMAHTGRIKGIDNFVLSGQWLQPPGGLPIAVVTGKDSIQQLCRKLGRPFVSDRSPAGDGPGLVPMVVPFRIEVDPMERLLLVNFEHDPDETYVGLEPQVFDDTVHGTGHLVIGWRRDGRVDVYHQPGLKLTPDRYDITGKGLAHMIERQFAAATYEVDDSGVQAHYEFADVHNRTVVIRINEQNPRRRKPFGLLAPMGSVAEAPSALPLVLLHDFYFVRRKHTVIEVSIEGRQHRPDELPVPMDFTRMLFTRYSPKPLIATLNPAFDGVLEPSSVQPFQAEVQVGDCILTLDWKGGSPAIRRMTRNHEIHPIVMRFHEPFPHLRSLADNTRVTGTFQIEGHPSTGRLAGRYTVDKANGQTAIVMIPTSGWKPRPTKLSLRFLYTVARVFRRWPATYQWSAILKEPEGGACSIRSGWCRIP